MAKPKVLLVDADIKNRQMLEISLKKGGFTVTATEHAEKALQLLDTYRPDLIISDIDLAGSMDGFLFCQVLKDQPRSANIPFIFLTSRKAVEDKIRGLELGVDDYLTKPIYLKEVIARARIIVDRKRQENIDSDTGTQSGQFQGDLSQMSIVDLLQTMEFGGKTGVLHLDKNEHTAKLYIRQGRVVHAVCDNLVGERAVYRTLLWNEGQFRIEFRKSLQTQETIQVSTQALIMEGMRRIDELERIKEQLPPFDSYLTIDSETILEEHPDRFPAKIENILAEFNGDQTLEQVVDSLPYDDLESLEIISKLYFQGYLIETEGPGAEPPADDTVTSAGSASQTARAKIPPVGATLDTQMLDLEETSRSIEEIKARARIAVQQKTQASTSESAGPSSAAPPAEAPAPSGQEPAEDQTGFELAPPPEEPTATATPASDETAERDGPASGAAATGPVAEPPVQSEAVPTKPSQAETPVPSPEAAPSPVSPPQGPGRPEAAPPPAPPSRTSVPTPPPATVETVEAGPSAPPSAARPEDDADAIAARLFDDDPGERVVNMPAPPPGRQTAAQPVARVATVRQPVPRASEEAAGAPAASAPPPPPPQDDLSLTHVGDRTMAQLGDATILSEASTGNRNLLLAIIGLLAIALVAIVILLMRQPQPGGYDEPDLYARAERAYEMVLQGQWATAQRIADDVLTENPDVPVALYARGKAREQLGRLSDARRDYERAVELNPAFHQAWLDLFRLRLAQGDDLAQLRKDVQKWLLRVDPTRDPDIYRDGLIFAAKLDIAARDWDQARTSLEAARKVAPDDPQIVILSGQIPSQTAPAPKPAAKPKPAVAAKSVAKPAAKPAPKPAAAPKKSKPTPQQQAAELHQKGLAYYRKGYLRNAQRALEQATQLDPKNDEIWVDLGRVLVELGEDRQAMEVFLSAGRLNPKNPRVWNNLGSLYMYQGDMERARKAFETYLELVPKDSQEAREIRRVLDNL